MSFGRDCVPVEALAKTETHCSTALLVPISALIHHGPQNFQQLQYWPQSPSTSLVKSPFQEDCERSIHQSFSARTHPSSPWHLHWICRARSEQHIGLGWFRGTYAEQGNRLPPGLYKIFDEILVNAADHKQRDPSMNMIKVEIDTENQFVSVWNNGSGIPIEIHQMEKVYVQVASNISEHITKKQKEMKIKPFQIKSHLSLYINCLIVNPAFDSLWI